MNRLIKFFIDNPVAANILMVFLLVGGYIWSTHVKQEVFPEYLIDEVVVEVAYPGASPVEIERGIILPIEEAVNGLDGIDKVISEAREGFGTVTIEATNDANIEKLYNDVKNQVDGITTFPEEAEKPTVYIPSKKREAITLILYGKLKEKTLRKLGEEIKDKILQFKNITNVELLGTKPFEISIEIPEDNLKKYNLTFSEVAEKIRNFNLEVGAGRMKTENGDILLRIDERRDYGIQLMDIPILRNDFGKVIKLKDIAKIKDNFEDIDSFLRYNGYPAIGIRVYRVGKQKPIEIAKTVKKFVKDLQKQLPPGVYVDYVNDRSKIFKQRIELLIKNAKLGLILVFALLTIFLEFRLAFWVMLGIPVSFLGSMLLFPHFNVTINMISLFAFIICLGIVVDDAIVVGENIYGYREKGYSFKEAAYLGATEVATPVIFSVLTNIIAFLPMYFVPGVMGKIFRIIPVIVASVFTISLIESLLILPSHIAHQKEEPFYPIKLINKVQKKISKYIHKFIYFFYRPVLKLAIKYRYITFTFAVMLLYLAVVFVKTGRIGIIFFPKVESDFAIVQFELPEKSSVNETLKIADYLTEKAKQIINKNGKDKLAQGILTRINGNSGWIQVYLRDPDIRPISTSEFVKKWRKLAGHIPGLKSIKYFSDFGGPGSGASLTVELQHKNTKILTKACKELATYLKTFKDVSDIDDGTSQGKLQYTIKINDKGKALGLTTSYIASQLRGAFFGIEAKRFIREENEVKIRVKLPEYQRDLRYYFDNFILTKSDGTKIPLKEVVNIIQTNSYTTITREDYKRIMYVTANVTPEKETRKIVKNLVTQFFPKLKKKYPGLNYSFGGKQSDLKEAMGVLVNGLIISLLVIFTMLAIPFKSYFQPIIIMTAIPFGIIGAIIGHLLLGYDLNIVSMFGIVALSGVVVNDSLVLIDFANRKRRNEGKTFFEAVYEAGLKRFRPIILTTLTTFFGLMPMIFETSVQARFLIPMAISLGFGILFSTFIVLILVPGLYIILEDLLGILKKFF